jgi:hypothetical protein
MPTGWAPDIVFRKQLWLQPQVWVDSLEVQDLATTTSEI